MLAFGRTKMVRPGDILVIETEPEALASALSDLGLTLEEAVQKQDAALEASPEEEARPAADEKQNAPAGDNDAPAARASDEVTLMELAVLPDSGLIGRCARDIHLRTRFGINLLAVSRQGRRSIVRLRAMPIRGGDVLLMQGAPEALLDFAGVFGCVPLAERPLRLPDRGQAVMAVSMAAGVAGAALGLLPAAIAFTAGVLATMAFKVIPLRTVYDSIDWPVIVLLGALIPVANAISTTGAADVIANAMLNQLAGGHAVLALAILLVVTMTLSDFMN